MKRILVANRGEIARRVVRTARSMGIGTVAVFSDADAHAPHVGEADVAVRLPGVSPAETYLDIDQVIAAALTTGADAVHPGYGFLSENATFARACADAGLTFIGPSPEAIEQMGSKIAAKELMAGAGVPVLGPDGFPLLVKAAFGGGGRGMRIVRDPADLDDALASARREAASAFGDGTVFVERYVEDPRHIEVQIFGDAHGNVIHLYERECSIQRRYQKIIEEAPSPAVTPELRAALCAAAVDAGRALRYVGAGTVEFVLDPSGAFFFLEVNTRLQVEHPVTELVTGLDLVELQIRVARGEALGAVPELRGWAVEARLYAEDVDGGFVPASGRIDQMSIPTSAGVRVDSGYETGSVVSTHYDAMLAKVIGSGPTREEAIGKLTAALVGTRIHGVPTNRALLIDTLRHPAFRAGDLDTGFLQRHVLSERDAVVPRAHAIAAALSGQAARRAATTVQPRVPSGWRNVWTQHQRTRFAHGDTTIDIGYSVRRDHARIDVDGIDVGDVLIWSQSAEEIDMTIDGVRCRYEVARYGASVCVDAADGSSALTELDRLPVPADVVAAGSLAAPLPGSVVRVLVGVGDAVVAGQTLLVLEAMKMEHALVSHTSGVVAQVHVELGEQVTAGEVLVVVEET